MLTLDQIKNVTFTKVRGGYATAEVDDFIDQCVDTVAGLIEERNTGNKKLEVLADKLVEYRDQEDSIRSVLVDARRLADGTVREANQKASLILDDARIKADKMIADAQTKAEEEVTSVSGEVLAQREELARLKGEVATFKRRLLSLYKEHLSLIDMLPEEPADPVETQDTPAEKAPDQPVEETAAVEAVEEETEQVVPAQEESVEEEPAEEVVPASASVPLSDLSLQDLVDQQEKAGDPQEPPKESGSRFGDLKFGDDYDIGEDTDPDQGHGGFFRRKK